MPGTCIEKLSHSCGSKDGLQVFENNGKYTGFCFSCGKYVSTPYEEGVAPPVQPTKKTQEEIEQEIRDISTYPVMDLPTRHLKKEYLEYFSIRVGVDETDGLTPRYVFFPYFDRDRTLISYKTRILDPKKMWFIGSGSRMPFGWFEALEANGKKLFITEGEFDAIALFQILKDLNKGTKWEELSPSIISFPNGASGILKALGDMYSEIKTNWSEIVLVPDQDKAGQEALQKISRAYPEIKIATLPAKDVNQCLLEGRKKAVQSAVMFKSAPLKNTRLLKGTDLIEKAKVRPEYGLSWPWEGMTKATRGIRRGETLYFGAGVKMGKSSLVNNLASHLILGHNLPVFLCKPEEASSKTFQKIVGACAGKIFDDPEIKWDEEAYDEYSKQVGEKVTLLDLYQFVNWEGLRDDIRYAVQVEGIRDVFIDPITCLTNQMKASETNEFLVSMTAELSAMAKDLDFTAYLFCHLKAPDSGPPHERGGKVLSQQFAGSRAMMRTCNYMIGLEGDKDPDLPLEERNVRDLIILEDREFGSSVKVRLYYDWQTGKFTEFT